MSKIQDSGKVFLMVGSTESTTSVDFVVCGTRDVKNVGLVEVTIDNLE